jgi:ribosome recycling factor
MFPNRRCLPFNREILRNSVLKDKEISEDDERYGLDEVQKLTNTYVGKIDELSKSKEKEIMSV